MATARTPSSFTVGWVCALPIELAAAGAMMDEEYEDLPQPPADTNIYTYGRIGIHNVVAACLPAGQMGNNSAAVVASQMRNSFPSLRFGVLVGIGGGVPSDEHDIRLGDVVISQPAGLHGGVVQSDFGKTGPGGRITPTGSLNAPPTILLNALAKLRANDLRGKARVGDHLSAFSALPKFACPGSQQDVLYAASSQHVSGPTCARCNQDDVVSRHARVTSEPVLFFGTIASGNQVMKDAPTRDRISQDLGGILCFEMEAAGLMNNFPCLVVRGICDYADAHKNKQWQPYAAATAAACTKELLRIVPQVVPTGDSRKEGPASKTHFAVPFGRNSDFVGRETVLERVLDLAPPDSNLHDCQRTVVVGLGGVGKTQIALEAAYRIHENYPDCSVFWVPAVDRNTFENAYRDIGLALGLPGIDDDESDVKNLVKMALSNGIISTKWLLVVDNTDETNLFFGTHGDPGLRDYLPFHRNGSILFTTRNYEVAVKLDIPLDQILQVTEMSETEADLMFQKTLRPEQQKDKQRTKELLELLACLPLAIKQASAFMAETGMSTAEYLELCHESDESQVELLSTEFEDRGRYPEIANPIATTWLISFHHLAHSYPLAVQYLKFVCFMGQKDIPKSLLPRGSSKIEEKRAFGVLLGYAFVSERDGGESFDVHRLVRLASINWFKEERMHITRNVIRHLATVYPLPRYENRDSCVRYMSHALVALGSGADYVDTKGGANLLTKIGTSYILLGQYAKAEPLFRWTLKLREKLMGHKHQDTLGSMYNLASVLNKQGKYAEAELLHQQTLELREEVLGFKHPNTLSSMNNLASVLNKQGKYAEAELLHRQTLELREEVLGSKHPDTLSSLYNLANVLDKQGNHAEAERLHRQTLKIREEVLGFKHPNTLSSINDLANVLNKQGKHAEAELLHRETLELREEVLGFKHPDTLGSMNNLANVLNKQGKHTEVEKLHRQTLELKEEVLGFKHPDTLRRINDQANVLNKQGKHTEVEKLHRQTLELKEEVLGYKHPDTLGSMNNLANVLNKQGKHAEVEKLHRQTLKLREEVLGFKHPDTLSSLYNLANVLNKQGKHAEAELLHRQTLELREEVLGFKHPDTLSSMNNLANVLNKQGKHTEVEKLHRQTLELREEVLGSKHPDTLGSLYNLANVLDKQGKHAEAELLHRQTLELREEVLGFKHPDTLSSLYNLANVLDTQGKYAEAEQLYRQVPELKKEVPSDKHPDTLRSIRNQAPVLNMMQSNHAEAEQLHSQTIQPRDEVLSRKRTSTLAHR